MRTEKKCWLHLSCWLMDKTLLKKCWLHSSHLIIIYILPPVETIRFCIVRVLCNCSEVVNFSLLMVLMHRMGIHYSVTFSIRVHYVLTNSPSLLALLLLFYHKFPMNIYHIYHRKFLFCINLGQPTFYKKTQVWL